MRLWRKADEPVLRGYALLSFTVNKVADVIEERPDVDPVKFLRDLAEAFDGEVGE